ncbi:MAG TPA: HupE/UreJ family protein [Kofleriaceae bacterium]
MRFWIAVVALVVAAGTAHAHQTSVKYVDVTVDGPRADVRFTVAPVDVTQALGLPADAQPSVAEAAVPAVARFVAAWLAVGPEGEPACAAGPAAAAPADDARFVTVAWRVTCAHDLGRIALDFGGFFALDRSHEAIVGVHAPGETADASIVRAPSPVLVVAAGERPSYTGWVAAGVDHIWEGRDHICFVLALLLVVMLVRVDGVWHTRAPILTLRATATIITAFTVAHSVSLIAAALGYVTLPSRFVECAIAVSILYTAIEDIIRPDVRWRFVLTFAFGLVHGLGFASVLRELLPPDHVIAPLLCFNLGVELGQLAIVLVALPLFWLACRELGAARYRRTVLPVLAGAIAALAVMWLVERLM